jgi:hypothetical protein
VRCWRAARSIRRIARCAAQRIGAIAPSCRSCSTTRRSRVTQVLVRLGMQNLLSVDTAHTLVTTVNKASGIESDLLYESVDAEADEAASAADGLTRCKLVERTLKGAAKVVQPCCVDVSALRRARRGVVWLADRRRCRRRCCRRTRRRILFPTGYVAFRHFWSTRGDHTALYCFRILPAAAARRAGRRGSVARRLDGALRAGALLRRRDVETMRRASARAQRHCAQSRRIGAPPRVEERRRALWLGDRGA